MIIGNTEIDPWNKRNLIPRVIAIVLVLGWLTWGLIIVREGRQLQAAFEQMQIEQQRQEERLRRATAYEKSRLEQQYNRTVSKNAVDNVRR